MARGSDYGRARQRGRNVALETADDRARIDDGSQQPRRKIQTVEEAGRPGARVRVHHLRSRGVGVLGDEVAGEPVIQQVGDSGQSVGGIDHRGSRAAGGEKLVERVERQKLDSGDGIELVTRNALKNGVHDSIGAGVPIMIRRFEQRAAFIEQRIVDAPSVDAETIERGNRKLAETPLHLRPQALNIPAQRRLRRKGLIGKAADLGHVENAGSKAPQHRPPALGSQIERQKVRAHKVTATTIFCPARR